MDCHVGLTAHHYLDDGALVPVRMANREAVTDEGHRAKRALVWTRLIYFTQKTTVNAIWSIAAIPNNIPTIAK